MNTPGQELAQQLRTWSTWYRLRRAAQAGMVGLMAGLAGWGILGAGTLAWRWLTQAEYLRLGAVSVMSAFLLGALVGLLWQTPRLRLARFYDREFHLQERTSTALELSSQPLEKYSPEAQSLMVSQLNDALAHARQVRPIRQFFLPWTRKQAVLFAALCALNAGLFFLGDSAFDQAAQQRQAEGAIEKAAEQVENLIAEVSQDAALSEAQRAELLEVLNRALEELKQANTLELAAATLAETEAALRAMDNPQARAQAEALQQAGSQLESALAENPASPMADFASQLAEGALESAAEALQAMELAALDPEEAGTLAEELASAAEALSATHPELAENLKQAASALQQGDATTAQQAMQRAASQLSQTSQQAAGAQAAQQAAAAVAQEQQQMLQAAGQGTQAGSGSQSGQGSQAGSSSQGGQGSQAGSGAGAGESSGSEAQGGETDDQPIQPGKPGDGGETTYTPLFAPQRLGGSEGEMVTLPPTNPAGETVIGLGENAPGQPIAPSVPYANVYAEYARAYWQAYDTTTVPPSLREIARLYFSALGITSP